MDLNKTDNTAGLFQRIKEQVKLNLDYYLQLYRQLYLEEFFIVFSLMFLVIVVISQVNILVPLSPFLLILFLIGTLLPLIKFAKDLPARSLLVRIPKEAIGGYLILLIIGGILLPALADRYTLITLTTILCLTIMYGLVTELLVAIDQNRLLINALHGKVERFQSPRAKSLQAITAGSYTRERVEREVSERMKAEQLRTELITNISHDIRTPLTSILNFSDLLGQEDLNIEARDYLGVVKKSAQRMKVMVDDLFTATKTATGNLQLDLKTVDFSEGLMQTYAPLHTMFQAKGLELVYNRVNQTIPVLADGTHLSRVIQNLLINAAKYSVNDTRVYIKVKEDPDHYRIAFINISKDMLDISPDELMEQFVRGDTARHNDGSGLGLYIATNLLKAMSGELVLRIDGDVFNAEITLPKGHNELIGELN